MNFLNALHALLGQHPQQNHAAPRQPVDPNYAQHVANNQPVDPRYVAAHAHDLQVQSQHSPANLGVPYQYARNGNVSIGQGGQFNPGFTPIQNSGFGPGGSPQLRAFNQPTPQPFNPQNNQNQQYWLP